MSIVVAGANGRLGRLTVAELLRTVPAREITAVVRTPGKAADLAGRGVTVVPGDYNDPASFDGLLRAGDKVLLISGNEFHRDIVAQHQVVIDAAARADVALLAYTSLLGTISGPVSVNHRRTEAALRARDLPHTLLRNGLYHEMATDALAPALRTGTIVRAAGQGRVASASRADYAAAAAAVLTGTGHEGAGYELGGDTAWSFAELAEEISRQSGTSVVYQPVTAGHYEKLLTDTGLPQPIAHAVAALDLNVADGECATRTGDLSRLTGRPTTPLAHAIATALHP
ncbi:NAD(P)H-binding protein [Kitasatospora fiedleri]|uniref:NAD(P)H-binding protein n=1 Tax=Kitasatospora fiedleri TaxID=2991545 RepID=UPI00249A0B1B|nr:NAD(P)H-binding protein [Kitasatospora fiedleri]